MCFHYLAKWEKVRNLFNNIHKHAARWFQPISFRLVKFPICFLRLQGTIQKIPSSMQPLITTCAASSNELTNTSLIRVCLRRKNWAIFAPTNSTFWFLTKFAQPFVYRLSSPDEGIMNYLHIFKLTLCMLFMHEAFNLLDLKASSVAKSA